MSHKRGTRLGPHQGRHVASHHRQNHSLGTTMCPIDLIAVKKMVKRRTVKTRSWVSACALCMREHTAERSFDYRGIPHPKSIQRQPLKIVDWRGELCRLLGLDISTSDDTVLEELARTEIILQEEAQRARSEAFEMDDLRPRGQVVYRITCLDSRHRQELYLEEPWISRSGPHQSHLRAGDAIRNFELFLERNKDISFVIYKDFECCGNSVSDNSWRGLHDDLASPISNHFVSESIQIISGDLHGALRKLSQGPLEDIRHPEFDVSGKDPITYPYLWWYHKRDEISKFEEQVDRLSREHIDIFRGYLLHRVGKDWDAVDSLIAKGKISSRYIEYLFVSHNNHTSELWLTLPRSQTRYWSLRQMGKRLPECRGRSLRAGFPSIDNSLNPMRIQSQLLLLTSTVSSGRLMATFNWTQDSLGSKTSPRRKYKR